MVIRRTQLLILNSLQIWCTNSDKNLFLDLLEFKKEVKGKAFEWGAVLQNNKCELNCGK